MRVTLLGWTVFEYHNPVVQETGWTTDAASDAEALIEYAGRMCYQSWEKPNPATQTSMGYIGHVMEQGHFSVIEHGVVTLQFDGVSRSFTHELIRHRHFSYSELSQRFVNVERANMIVPRAVLEDDKEAQETIQLGFAHMRIAYKKLVDRFTLQGKTRKQAREAARAVMPNATETQIIVTGNLRAWRHFISVRATEHADAEMCAAAVQVAWILKQRFPAVFQDMHLKVLEDRDVIYFGEVDYGA